MITDTQQIQAVFQFKDDNKLTLFYYIYVIVVGALYV